MKNSEFEGYSLLWIDGVSGTISHDLKHHLADGAIMVRDKQSLRIYVPEKKPWSGEGLPQVGTVCEFSDHGEPAKWTRCRVIAFDDKAVVFKIMYPTNTKHYLEYDARFVESLRPIRTQEQIAAEERERDVIAALEVMKKAHWQLADTQLSPLEKCRVYAEAMVEAGYRKEVKP